MSKVTKEIVIARPIERVFQALVTPQERGAWVRTLQEESREAPLRLGDKVGATRRGSTSGSRYTLTVTGLEAPRRLAVDVARNGQHVGRNTFELAAMPEGTRVRGLAEVQLSGLQRMMTSVVAAAAEVEMEAELGALKRYVESH